MTRGLRCAAIALAASVAIAAFPISGETYPSRPIRIVVPFGPGGFTDVVARILQQQLHEAMGQPVVIENRPGAGSTIGTDAVAKAKADGYTLVMVSTTHVISAHLYKALPYDPIKDFTPIGKLCEGPYVLVAHPSLAVDSVAQLIALARSQPGKIDYASSGNGSSQHLVGALFVSMAGAPLSHVPYKGSGQAMQDLVGGQVKVGFVGMPNALPQVTAGKLKALAVTTRQRSPDLPQVPTLDEAGVAGFEATIWLGLLAPAGTPRDVVQKLYAAARRALSTPEARKSLERAGVEVSLSSPEEFAALLETERDRWGKVVRETGATVN